MAEQIRQYIDGAWRTGQGGTSSPVFNPATEEVHAELPHASPADVGDAVAAAARAFSTWRRVPAMERATLVRGIGDTLRARKEDIACRITRELGKPLGEARKEVDTAAEMFDWAAEEARRSYGRLIPARSPGVTQSAVLEPVGPVAAFSGWNAPLITPSRKISGALAAGCSIVIKPSEETPSVALAIAEAAAEVGLPSGLLNMVFGDPAAIADQLLDAPDIAMVTFTGGTSIGKQIGAKAAATMKRATLELGGHAPVVVCDDVDVEAVVRSAVATKFRNAGQVCTSPTRFYVQEGIYARFADLFVQAAQALRVGDGLHDGVQMGPLKNARRRDAVERMVADARRGGITVAAGGERLEGRGFFYPPTVLLDFPDECLAANEEPFGPIAMLRPFGTLDDAVTQANRLPFGLAAYVFTRDVTRARHLAEAVESGVVCVNEWQASLPETPFGGVKDSGLGSEGGIEGLREFQRTKCVRQGLVGV